MKKIMKQYNVVLFLFALMLQMMVPWNIVFAQETNDQWQEVTTSEIGKIDIGDAFVYYGFGAEHDIYNNNFQRISDVLISRPTVFLAKNNSVIRHIWENGNSSSNLLFAFPSNEGKDGYKIYSAIGQAEKMYIRGSNASEDLQIKAESNINVADYGTLKTEMILSPIGKEFIKHEHIVTNTGDTPVTFKFLKSVDTELAGNDHVPVKHLGDNRGLYIETGQYRLDYFLKVENGPDNYRNWYTGGYRRPRTDGFENIAIPFVNPEHVGTSGYNSFQNFTILGVGDEILNAAKNTESMGRGDSGIWMKWNDVTLNPGESKAFTYYIGIYPAVKGSQVVLNINKNDNALNSQNVMKEEMEFQVSTLISALRVQDVQEGSLILDFVLQEDTSNGKNDLLFKNIGLYDSNNQLLRSYNVADVYDQQNKQMRIAYTKANVPADGVIVLKYTLDVNKQADDRFINESRYLLTNVLHSAMINGQAITYKSTSKVKIDKKPIPSISIYFVDEEGNEIAAMQSLQGLYEEVYQFTPVDIANYSLKQVAGLCADLQSCSGKFLDEYLLNGAIVTPEIRYTYSKKTSTIKYQFVSGTPQMNLPKQVTDLQPIDGNAFYGDIIQAEDFTNRRVDVALGSWVFQGFDTSLLTVDEDVETFIGTWMFKLKVLPIEHSPEIDVADTAKIAKTVSIPKTMDDTNMLQYCFILCMSIFGIYVFKKKIVSL